MTTIGMIVWGLACGLAGSLATLLLLDEPTPAERDREARR